MISVLTPSIRPAGLKVTQETLKAQTNQDFEWLVEVSIPERGHDLNAAYNRMLRRVQGEMIVSLQDFIAIPTDALEKIAAMTPAFYTFPVGKVYEWGETAKFDWRVHTEEATWKKWEIDFGAAPLQALKDIGGFDEAMDGRWSGDNVNVAYRAYKAGWTFACVPEIKAIAWDHDAHEEHPFRRYYHPDEHNKRLKDFDNGVTLDYLS